MEHEHSPRATKLRVYTRQVNVRSKAVFSNAMTLMDKIRGWEACMWIHTKEDLTGGQNTRQGTRRVPEETHDVHHALHKLGL